MKLIMMKNLKNFLLQIIKERKTSASLKNDSNKNENVCQKNDKI